MGFLPHRAKPVSYKALFCHQAVHSLGNSDLERVSKPLRPAGRQSPGVPFQLGLLRQGEGRAGGTRCWIPQQSWEGAEPRVAIKHKSHAQEVPSMVVRVLASPSSLHHPEGAGFSFIPELP